MTREVLRRFDGRPTQSGRDLLSSEPPFIARNPEVAGLAAMLRATAPEAVMDPLVRASLRMRLVGTPVSSAPCYASLETPVGQLWIAYRGDVPSLIALGDEADFLAKARAVLGTPPRPEGAPPPRLARRVLAAIRGERRYHGPLDLSSVTDFQRSVLEQTRRIPRGEVRSYAWIAREIGHPRAVRAVGTALARNPLPFVIPCHRVIRGDGDLGDYSAGGTEMKQRVLQYEGVDLAYLRQLATRGIRFRGSRTTRVFCLPTCYSHRWAREQHTVFFHSADEALAAGFRPCKLCRPVGSA